MKIYIGIPTYNRKDLLSRLLDSLKPSMEHINKIIVVDNGQQNIELSNPKFELIVNSSNRGYGGGCNQAIAEAKRGDADWVLLLNDDITYYPWQLEKLVPLLEICSERWLLTPDWQWDSIAISKLGIKALEFTEGQWFDEQFWPGYYGDNDLHWRIRCTGEESKRMVGAIPELTPWIKDKSKTRERAPELNHMASTPLYIKKWGGLPGQEQFRTPYNDSTI